MLTFHANVEFLNEAGASPRKQKGRPEGRPLSHPRNFDAFGSRATWRIQIGARPLTD